MDHRYRELAPITEEAWSAIDEEAARTLRTTLAARKVVDVTGPLGWNVSSVDLGRIRATRKTPALGAEVRVRSVQPLMEVRVPFEISREEIEAMGRGARDADLSAIVKAARIAAVTEDTAAFNGFESGSIKGLTEVADQRLELPESYSHYADVLAEGITRLRGGGVDGPYALLLGPRCYEGVNRATHSGGYPVMEHVHKLIDGPLIWAPALAGSMLLSTRGEDFILTLGTDYGIGYVNHDARTVELFIEESFTFHVDAPEAVIPLLPVDAEDEAAELKRFIGAR